MIKVLLLAITVTLSSVIYASEKPSSSDEKINASFEKPNSKPLNELWYTYEWILMNDGCYHLHRQAHMSDMFGSVVDYPPMLYYPNPMYSFISTVIGCMDEEVFENFC